MPEVWMSPRMQRIVGGKEQVQVAGATIRQVVNNLDKEYPGIKDELCEDGELNPGIAVVVDGETSNLGMLERVKEDSEIHFIPAMSGAPAASAFLSESSGQGVTSGPPLVGLVGAPPHRLHHPLSVIPSQYSDAAGPYSHRPYRPTRRTRKACASRAQGLLRMVHCGGKRCS